MNSLPWIGKISGCLGADAVIERLGYKKAMYLVAAIQCVAIIGKLSCNSEDEHEVSDVTYSRANQQ